MVVVNRWILWCVEINHKLMDLLQKFYDQEFNRPGDKPFDELSDDEKLWIKSSTGFAVYKLKIAIQEFKNEFKKIIRA